MLDMGFIHDIRKILALLPERRQNLLFSATFSTEIRRLADGLLDDPASVQVTPRNTPTELVTQVVHLVDRERKRELLTHLDRAPAGSTRRSSSRARSTVPTGSPSSSSATASPPPRSTATRASPSASARWPTSRPAGSRSSSRPTSPRAASTSRRCRTSSTSSCRWSPRTTSTASAGPGAPASTATPSRWSASTRLKLLARHRARAGPPDPARDDRGLRARSADPTRADPAGRAGWIPPVALDVGRRCATTRRRATTRRWSQARWRPPSRWCHASCRRAGRGRCPPPRCRAPTRRSSTRRRSARWSTSGQSRRGFRRSATTGAGDRQRRRSATGLRWPAIRTADRRRRPVPIGRTGRRLRPAATVEPGHGHARRASGATRKRPRG